MLTIDPSSYCDVCFSSFVDLPHCIDCGHVFCSTCLDSICEKTWSPRQSPACPFCRETFTRTSARKVRVELKTPRLPLKEIDDNDTEVHMTEVKRLEEKVAKAAASKCSFEEVCELHREIQVWLASEVKRRSTEQHASLQLSAALLRAILLNCLAYDEASKVAKGVESNLKERLDSAQQIKEKLEVELQKQRLQYAQKVRECQELRSEINRLKLTSIPSQQGRPPPLGLPPRSFSTPSPLSRSSSVRPAATPTVPSFPRPSYFQRPSSASPMSIKNTSHSNVLHVGSAPISNTLSSALKLQAPLKEREVSIQATEDEKAFQRWVPNSDDESALSDATKVSKGTSATARSHTTSSTTNQKWSLRSQLPPVPI